MSEEQNTAVDTELGMGACAPARARSRKFTSCLGEHEIETIAKTMVADPGKFGLYQITYIVCACHSGDQFERGRFHYLDDAILYLRAKRKTFAANSESYICVAHFDTNFKEKPFARFLDVETGAEFFFSKKEAT